MLWYQKEFHDYFAYWLSWVRLSYIHFSDWILEMDKLYGGALNRQITVLGPSFSVSNCYVHTFNKRVSSTRKQTCCVREWWFSALSFIISFVWWNNVLENCHVIKIQYLSFWKLCMFSCKWGLDTSMSNRNGGPPNILFWHDCRNKYVDSQILVLSN